MQGGAYDIIYPKISFLRTRNEGNVTDFLANQIWKYPWLGRWLDRLSPVVALQFAPGLNSTCVNTYVEFVPQHRNQYNLVTWESVSDEPNVYCVRIA